MKEQFSLPEDQCERLVRVEMQAVRMMLATSQHSRLCKGRPEKAPGVRSIRERTDADGSGRAPIRDQ